MKTEVKGHMSHRGNKEFYIEPHIMHVNKHIHKRHEHRIDQEIKYLKRLKARA